MTTTPAGQPSPVFRHPAALESMTDSGTGLLEYFRINDNFHRKFAPYYGDVGRELRSHLQMESTLNKDVDPKKAAAQIHRRLLAAEQSELLTAALLVRARRIYVAAWGDPNRRRATSSRKFNPDV